MSIENSNCILEIKTDSDSAPFRVWKSLENEDDYYIELYDLTDEGYMFKRHELLDDSITVLKYLLEIKEFCIQGSFNEPVKNLTGDPTGAGCFHFKIENGIKKWYRRTFIPDSDKQLIVVQKVIDDLEKMIF
jgi:hypothetical protein